MEKVCDIVIAVWNLKEKTEVCIESIIKHTKFPYRIIIVDNGSEDPTKSYLEDLKNDARIPAYLLIRNEENRGATKAFNQGMEASSASYILLINNDTIVTDGWLTEMMGALESAADVGIVNPDSNNMGTQISKNMSLDEFEKQCVRQHRGEYIDMGDACGFCYLMKREVLDKIGLWNDSYGFGNYEETEHCIFARKAGYRMVMAKGAFVFHEEHSTFNMLELQGVDVEKDFEENKIKFEAKYGKTQRILYAVIGKRSEVLAKVSEDMYTAGYNAKWVDAFIVKKHREYKFRKHGWIRFFFYPMLGFRLRCLSRVLVKKKKFDEIFVDDSLLYSLVSLTRGIHKAKVTMI